jgi:FG-GAP-like repeat
MKHAMRYACAYAARVMTPNSCGTMRVCLVASLVFFMTLAASASTVSFRPLKTYSVGSNPTAIAVGDFNGDGRPDLAVLDSGGSTPTDQGGVSILFGKRDGTFEAAKNITAGKNCTGIAVGDFNGDGKDDLALVRPGDPSVGDNGDVTIFLGNGDGTFRQGTVLTAGENPNGSIAVADLNGDQKLDLVVVSTGDHSADVLLGNGDGSFQAPAAYVIGSLIQHVAVGDFNRDGKQDLIGSPSQFVLVDGAILLGNGDGTFRQVPSLAVPPFVAPPAATRSCWGMAMEPFRLDCHSPKLSSVQPILTVTASSISSA